LPVGGKERACCAILLLPAFWLAPYSSRQQASKLPNHCHIYDTLCHSKALDFASFAFHRSAFDSSDIWGAFLDILGIG
jgi:hypothetical protein